MNQACPSIYPDPGLGPSFTLHPNPFMSKNLDVEVKVTRIQTCLRFYTYIHTYIQVRISKSYIASFSIYCIIIKSCKDKCNICVYSV